MTVSGGLIAESLRVPSVLADVAFTVTRISRAEVGDVDAGQPRAWAFLGFEIADRDCEPRIDWPESAERRRRSPAARMRDCGHVGDRIPIERPMTRFDAPRTVAPTADERELLLRYLQRQRELVVATADGLTDEQAAWTPPGRLLPIAGVINHLTHVEWRWIEGRYLGNEFPAREEEFRLGTVPLGSVVEAYRQRARRTDEVVRAAPGLEVACLGCEGAFPPAHTLLGLDQPIDLRWTLLHLIEETAHHAGHADSTREMLDGSRRG